ncbi:hypothetical protein ACFOWE_27140 [Planomonospora corallina]|uniref:Uncharacterized protein n=1 Tax=Planomonospora corallina TaxID=1806052 RepID=A0ABV8IHQ8_9ACTN
MGTAAWPVYSPFAREHYGHGLEAGRAEGRLEGMVEEAARVVLLVLAARGLEVPDDTRARITACTDLALLEVWVIRAATVQSVHDLFGEAGGEDR